VPIANPLAGKAAAGCQRVHNRVVRMAVAHEVQILMFLVTQANLLILSGSIEGLGEKCLKNWMLAPPDFRYTVSGCTGELRTCLPVVIGRGLISRGGWRDAKRGFWGSRGVCDVSY
jgi:hypothetical protein